MNKIKAFYMFSVFLVICFFVMLYVVFGMDTKNSTMNMNTNNVDSINTGTNNTTPNNHTNLASNNVAATNNLSNVNTSTPSIQKKADLFKACYSLATIGENQKTVNDTLAHFTDITKKISSNEERAIVYFDLGQDKAHATSLFNQYQDTIFKGFNVEQDANSYIVRVATLASYNNAKVQVDGLNAAMKDKNIDGTWHAKNITKLNYAMTINSAKSEAMLTEALKNQGKLSKVSCE